MLSKALAAPPLHFAVRALRRPPIFQIGFNKCGTTSLHKFFIDSGIAALHWREGRLAKRMAARIDAGQDPVRDFPSTIAFTDIVGGGPSERIEPYKRFEYLHHWHPEALFILNTRDREKWVASRTSHEYQGKRLIAAYAAYLGISETEVQDFWRAEWDVHLTLVRAYFREKPNFLEFNIEADDPQKLITFVARRYPQAARTPFGVYNPTQ